LSVGFTYIAYVRFDMLSINLFLSIPRSLLTASLWHPLDIPSVPSRHPLISSGILTASPRFQHFHGLLTVFSRHNHDLLIALHYILTTLISRFYMIHCSSESWRRGKKGTLGLFYEHGNKAEGD
jgi:hypothetical protein